MGTFKRILIVDDCATIRMILRVYLMNLGAELVEASNASEALDLLHARPCDLVISDVRMAPMDGIAFVQAIRTDTSLKVRAIPVLLMTGDQDEGLKTRGLAAGANGFVRKPISPTALMQTIDSIAKSAAA